MTKTREEKIFEAIEKTEALLFANDICCDVDQYNDLPVISVRISWGDWKHSHLRAKYLIEHELGYTFISSKTTESDGSDCYSAKHYFAI